jgi:hypothetical protein
MRGRRRAEAVALRPYTLWLLYACAFHLLGRREGVHVNPHPRGGGVLLPQHPYLQLVARCGVHRLAEDCAPGLRHREEQVDGRATLDCGVGVHAHLRFAAVRGVGRDQPLRSWWQQVR